MSFNDLKKKYNPDPAPQVQTPPVPTDSYDPAGSFDSPGTFDPEPFTPWQPELPPAQPPAYKPDPPMLFPPEPVSGSSGDLGIFGDDNNVSSRNTRRFPRFNFRGLFRSRSHGSGFSFPNLAALPWLDIIMILLTLAGVGWVIANFDAVTLLLFVGICKIMQWLIVLLIIAAILLVLFFMFTSRRRPRLW